MGKLIFLRGDPSQGQLDHRPSSVHRSAKRRDAPADPHTLPVRRRMFAHRDMLEFIRVREGIRLHTEELSAFYRPRGPPEPADIDMRICRVSYAMYLVDMLDRMLHVVDRRTELASSFESARKTIREMLPDDFFSFSAERITQDFLAHEETLRHPAARFGIDLLRPEPAVALFKARLAEEIDRINGR